MTVEIRFLSPGWEINDGPANDKEVVNPGETLGKEFKKGRKHFRVECGTSTLESRRLDRTKHLDDGGKVHFWDEGTELNAPEGKGNSLRLDTDVGNIECAHALAEIGQNGSVKLTVDEVDVAEIRHIPR